MKDGWHEVRLGDLVRITHGWAFKSQFFSDFVPGLPIVVGIGNFRYTGGFRFDSTALKGYTGDYPEEFVLKPGDILLVMTCQTAGDEILGIPGRIPDDGRKYLHNQRMGNVVNTDSTRVDANFLYWLFLTPDFNRHLVATASGTKILHTAPSRIESYRFRLPPLPIQRRIAEVLGALDDKIECNRRINQTLEAMAQALYKHWFVDFGPFRGGEFVDSELGPIPKGWEVATVGETCNLLMGQSPPSKFYNEVGEGLPFHQGVTNFGWRFPKHITYCTELARIVEGGSILFSVRAPVGRINVADRRIVIGRGIAAINHKRGWNSFLLYQLRAIFTMEDTIGSGTIFNAVTKADLENVKVIRPPDDLVEKFNTTVSTYDKQIEVNERESETLAHTRDYLLPKLLSGEAKVKAVEPGPSV